MTDGGGVLNVAATALLDTGATKSAISPRIIKVLGLQVLEKRPLTVATELRLVNFFLFRIGLLNGQGGALPFVFEESDGFQIDQTGDFEVLIGMDILRQCEFSMARQGMWTLRCG